MMQSLLWGPPSSEAWGPSGCLILPEESQQWTSRLGNRLPGWGAGPRSPPQRSGAGSVGLVHVDLGGRVAPGHGRHQGLRTSGSCGRQPGRLLFPQDPPGPAPGPHPPSQPEPRSLTCMGSAGRLCTATGWLEKGVGTQGALRLSPGLHYWPCTGVRREAGGQLWRAWAPVSVTKP